ncbi:MAG: oligosaccharide flippase family protein [Bacteroidetes bacterium]|nr:oligosaccharide flippase family protein [Bacteroidota bacterium]
MFPLILFPYMTRTLGPAGYGVLGYYESLLSVIVVWAAFGVPYYGLRLLSKTTIGDANQSNAVLHLLLINFCMALVGLVGYLVYVLLKPMQIGPWQVTALYGFIILVYMFHADWYFQSQEQYSFLVKRTFYLRLYVLVSSVLLVHSEQHLMRYVVISAINYALIAMSAGWQLRTLFRYWRWDPPLFKTLLKALWPFALLGLLGAVYISLDTILLARLGQVVALGHYSVAAKIVRLGLNVFIAASIVFFVRLFRTEVDKSLQADSLLLTLHLSIPIGALLFFFAEPVIRFVSGDHYLPAVSILQWFSLLWVIVPFHDFFNIQVLMVHHREKALVYLYGAACIMSLVLNLVLVNYWFTLGAVWAILITETFVLAAGIWLSRGYFNLSRGILLQLASCLLIFPVAAGVRYLTSKYQWPPVVELTIGITVSLLVYAAIQWWLLKNSFWKKLAAAASRRA